MIFQFISNQIEGLNSKNRNIFMEKMLQTHCSAHCTDCARTVELKCSCACPETDVCVAGTDAVFTDQYRGYTFTHTTLLLRVSDSSEFCLSTLLPACARHGCGCLSLTPCHTVNSRGGSVNNTVARSFGKLAFN